MSLPVCFMPQLRNPSRFLCLGTALPFPIADRNHDIVRGRLNRFRLNRFLKPRHPAKPWSPKEFFRGSGYYTHNTQGYLARPESLVIPYQDKTFLQ